MMRRLMLLASLALLASACADASAAEAVRPGWENIVVTTRDLPAGTVVTFEDLAQLAVPEGTVSTSVVRPDNVNLLVNRRLLLPLLKGDAVSWAFILEGPEAIQQACAKHEEEGASAARQVARARQRILSPGR